MNYCIAEDITEKKVLNTMAIVDLTMDLNVRIAKSSNKNLSHSQITMMKTKEQWS